ncbi:MAG: hypothetical protein ACLR4Z_06800 [Butyricicoccaceae bacterium]
MSRDSGCDGGFRALYVRLSVFPAASREIGFHAKAQDFRSARWSAPAQQSQLLCRVILDEICNLVGQGRSGRNHPHHCRYDNSKPF